MLRSVVVVRYISTCDCFAHVSFKDFQTADKNVNCVKVSWEDKSCLLWCVDSYSTEGCLSINSLFAKKLHLDEGTAVCVAPHSSPPPVQRVTIHPDTEDDMEILESNALKLQESLLNQIRILEKDHKMVVWVAPSLPINITPSETCSIQQQTEIVIKYQNKEQSFSNVAFTDNTTEVLQKDLVSNAKLIINYYIQDVDKTISKYLEKSQTYLLGRIIVANKISNPLYKHLFSTDQHFVVYVQNNRNFEEGVYNFKCMVSASDNQERKPIHLSKNIFVDVKKIDVLPMKEFKLMDKYVPVVVPKTLADLLNLDYGKKVVLEKIVSKITEPELIELTPVFSSNPVPTDDLLRDFKMYITVHFSKEKPLLVNNGFIISLLPYKSVSCQVTLHPPNVLFVNLYGEMFRQYRVIVNSEPVQPYDSATHSSLSFDCNEMCRSVKSFGRIIENCTNILKYNISKESSSTVSSSSSHIIVTGPPGSGKTSLCQCIASDMGIWFTRLDCRAIKGRKDVLEHFYRKLQSCEEHSPSLLICDDIETIIPRQSEELSHQDRAFYDMLVYSIREFMKNCSGVFVILTSASLDDINDLFHAVKGELLVPFTFSIPDLELTERVELLKFITYNSLYNSNIVTDGDYSSMAMETEGFTVKDLQDYITKRVFRAVKQAVHFSNKALELKSSLDEQSNENNSSKTEDVWSTIGGMEHIKQSLVEILCWPLKYPVLFPKQPGGVLLFGSPGTGKSLIGSCVAKFSQLSFICVKGPELLSKYIGQSEQAVRNLFEKAEKKKPCILFFDEFDSLAPRRGHDSTGVTDRVVNQLLTQMDGVEGAIKGVTVLAATSRPDLLDGALLRPGRFDTTIHCDMPSETDRLEILRVLSRGLKLSDDVNLAELAEMTEGFTGADIKSVLSTAQLQCLEDKIEEMSTSEATVAFSEVTITRDHLMDALANTRPSLTPQQLQFYDIMYSRFLNKLLTEEEKTIHEQMTRRLRATLA